MKINWKLRVQNKATLMALVAAVLAFVYNALGLLGVVPRVAQSAVFEVIALLVNVLVMLGVVADPTTPGLGDSARAQGYGTPGGVAKE